MTLESGCGLIALVRKGIAVQYDQIYICLCRVLALKGTRHKQNSLSGNTLFNYMPTYTRSQKKS